MHSKDEFKVKIKRLIKSAYTRWKLFIYVYVFGRRAIVDSVQIKWEHIFVNQIFPINFPVNHLGKLGTERNH